MKKREKIQSINIINENEAITRDATDIKKTMRGYCEQPLIGEDNKNPVKNRQHTWTDTSIKMYK